MRVLVTGNLGYLGVEMTDCLQAAGHQVVGLDADYFSNGDFGSAPAGPRRPLERQITKDVRDVRPADLEGIEAVVHLAALSNDPTGELDPALTDEINHRASVRLAETARAAGARRFLFSSSCSVYGQGEEQSLNERSTVHPLTAYARSKVDTEVDVARLASQDFSPVFLRNATAYGLTRRLRFDLVVNNLTGSAVATGQVKLLSDGRAWRPIVHAGDIAHAFEVVLAAPREAIHNQIFNVGCDDDNYQVRQIADCVARVVPDCKVTYGEGAGADSRTYNVSFAKIREQLPDFHPSWTLAAGVRDLYAACQARGLTREEFASRNYTRLKQLNYLLDSGQLDPALRWRQSVETA
jgi:nucleoside-diphosphate-sugar epimerase